MASLTEKTSRFKGMPWGQVTRHSTERRMFRGSRSWLVKDLIFQGWVLREQNETKRERERE